MADGDIVSLLSPLKPRIANNPEPGMVVPHVYSFSSLINTQARTYSYRYDEALRHLPSNALAMKRDAFIQSLLQERNFPTAQRPWSITVPDRKDAYQSFVSKSVTQAIRAIPRFDSMRLYLMQADWYGRYGSHVKPVQRKIMDKVLWTVGEHRPVNGDKIQYGWDGTPGVAINPTGASAYPSELISRTDRGLTLLKLHRPEHRRQFIIHRHIVDDADYFEPEMAGGVHGLGLRSQIYWSWWLRDEMLSWAVDFMQKVGTLGLLVFTYEEGNANAKTAAETAAAAASNETALTMPMPAGANTKPTSAVQHIPASSGGIEALTRLIQEYFERHMERLIVGQPSSGGVAGNGFGGSAGASMHSDTKYQIMKFDAGNLDETLTQDLVGMIVEMNFPEVDFPVRFQSSVPNPEDAAKLQGIQTAVGMGVDFKTDEVRDLTGASKPEEGDDIIGGQDALDEANAAAAPPPFGADGDKTEPGQGLTSNDKVERENGSGESWDN